MFKRVFLLLVIAILFLAAQTPGTYKGTWASGSSGGGGKLNFAFTSSGLAEASFTIQGDEVKAKAISSKADSSTVDFIFEYDINGTLLRSRMQGSVNGKSMKGKYQSAPADGGASVDEGTWEVTQQ